MAHEKPFQGRKLVVTFSSSTGPAWWSWSVSVTEGEEEHDGDGSTDDAKYAQDWAE